MSSDESMENQGMADPKKELTLEELVTKTYSEFNRIQRRRCDALIAKGYGQGAAVYVCTYDSSLREYLKQFLHLVKK